MLNDITMRAALWHGQQDLRVEERDVANVGTNDVRVEVDTCGICGSDLHEYTAGPIFIPDEAPHPVSGETAPITMGHSIPTRSSPTASVSMASSTTGSKPSSTRRASR